MDRPLRPTYPFGVSGIILLAAQMFASATSVTAAPVSFNGSGLTIADNSSASSDIGITGFGASVSAVQVTLIGLNHSFIGDLVVTLTHVESGTTIDLFSRVGRVGGSGLGDSANLAGNYTFANGASGDLWAQALSSTDTSFIVPPGAYFPTTVDGAGTSFSVFFGVPLDGTWRLTISDLSSGDTGSLTAWQLTADTTVPEPATGLMLLVGVAGGLALRRRDSEECHQERAQR